jgi:hypothetical protein
MGGYSNGVDRVYILKVPRLDMDGFPDVISAGKQALAGSVRLADREKSEEILNDIEKWLKELREENIRSWEEPAQTPKAKDRETKVLTDDEYQRRVAPKATTTSEGK